MRIGLGTELSQRGERDNALSPIAAFYPSLHLNLGDCYPRVGDLDRARKHFKRVLDAVVTLADDGYGR